MRGTEHFKRHLSVRSSVDGKTIAAVNIEDPFHTTRVVVGWNLRDWLKMLFRRKREIEVCVKVQADGVATRRWFQGQDVCEVCKKTPIGYPHDGSSAADPGYHEGTERLCERCYYGVPDEPGQAMTCNTSQDRD